MLDDEDIPGGLEQELLDDARDRNRGTLGSADGVAAGFGVVNDAMHDVVEGVGTLAGAVGAIGGVVGDKTLERVGELVDDLSDVIKYQDYISDGIDLIRDALALLGPKVEYRFETKNTEQNVLARSDWQVQDVDFIEELNAPYAAIVKVATKDIESDPAVLLGANAILTSSRESLQRGLRGVIKRVEQGGVTDELASYRLTIVPAFELMSQRVTSRVFQDMTVLEILAEVLTEGLLPFGRDFDDSFITAVYPKRETCVQYNESDLAFCQRLMEEEGIIYAFFHGEQKETLVLLDITNRDDKRKFTKLETQDRLGVPISAEASVGVESVRSFVRERSLVPTSVFVADWNWTIGGAEVRKQESVDGHGRNREEFDHVHELTLHQYSWPWYSASNVDRQATLRRRRQVQMESRFRGLGFVIQMMPGLRFELTGHSNPELNGEYLITKVRHVNDAPPDMQTDRLANQLNYYNEFECVPVDVPFAPERRTPKPRIHGAQTALVCGPDDQRVHTDEWGRIKIWYHWDLQNPDGGDRFNDRLMSWVRVQQMTAGNGFGSVFIPHVGMEVVVTFLNGDPDRPLVTGAVYAAENFPPYALPQDHDKSTIKTVSGNELRFDDAPGNEEVYIHAQRDFNERVERSHSTSVGGSQSNTVGGSHSVSVGGNESVTVHRDQTITIEQNRTETVTQNETVTVIGNRSLDVQGGEDKTTVKGLHSVTVEGDIVLDASASITLRVGQTEIVLLPESIDLHTANGAGSRMTDIVNVWSNDGSELTLDATVAMADKDGGTIIVAGGDLALESAHGGKMVVNADMISTAGNSMVALKAASLEMSSDAVVAVGMGAEISLKESSATLSAVTTAAMAAGTGAIECNAEGAKVTGTHVGVEGTTISLN